MLEKLSVYFPHQHVIHFVLRAATVRAVLCEQIRRAWDRSHVALESCSLPTALSPSSSGWPHPSCHQERLQVWVTPHPRWEVFPTQTQTQPCQGHCKELAQSICVDKGCVCCGYNHINYWENLPVSFFFPFLCDASWWKG